MSSALIYGMMNDREPEKVFRTWEPDETSEKILRAFALVWTGVASGGVVAVAAPLVPFVAAHPVITYKVLKETTKIIVLGDEDPKSPLLEKGVDMATAEAVIFLVKKIIE